MQSDEDVEGAETSFAEENEVQVSAIQSRLDNNKSAIKDFEIIHEQIICIEEEEELERRYDEFNAFETKFHSVIAEATALIHRLSAKPFRSPILSPSPQRSNQNQVLINVENEQNEAGSSQNQPQGKANQIPIQANRVVNREENQSHPGAVISDESNHIVIPAPVSVAAPSADNSTDNNGLLDYQSTNIVRMGVLTAIQVPLRSLRDHPCIYRYSIFRNLTDNANFLTHSLKASSRLSTITLSCPLCRNFFT